MTAGGPASVQVGSAPVRLVFIPKNWTAAISATARGSASVALPAAESQHPFWSSVSPPWPRNEFLRENGSRATVVVVHSSETRFAKKRSAGTDGKLDAFEEPQPSTR